MAIGMRLMESCLTFAADNGSGKSQPQSFMKDDFAGLQPQLFPGVRPMEPRILPVAGIFG